MVIAFLRKNLFHRDYYRDFIMFTSGEYNGYVAFDAELPPSHQGGFSSNSEEETLDDLVTVHGGITYDRPKMGKYSLEIIPITAMPDPEIFQNFRVIGFDCCLPGDSPEQWPVEKVKEETMKLKNQIEQLIERYKTKK